MVSPRTTPGPQIPQFYAGRSVFITGATGFMGKVLIERLLSTCPDIGRLYLLMRTKKDILPEKRLLQLKQSQVFDNIRQSDPYQLEKLYIIPGDVEKPQLGISIECLSQLQDVSIVFHSAATLKFDEELKKAVNQNVRSVMRLMDICDRLPSVEAFIHVSTAYSNAEKDIVDEQVYPPPAPLDELLTMVDVTPTELLADITNKYISPKPNTYCFTKSMAEIAVEQHTNRKYSVAIFRPTIVISSHRNPYPGWIENMNGPSGVVAGAGKGLLHVFCCKTQAQADMLPVDIAIDTLIAVAWETAVDRSPAVKVYNCSSIENKTTWGEFSVVIRRCLRTHPLDQAFWYPFGTAIENTYMEKTLEILLQSIPLHLAEYVAKLCRIKTRVSLITADQKLRSMSKVLKFFALREWRFSNGNVRKLRERLSKDDARIFNLDTRTINWEEQYRNFVIGTRKYLLKEKDQDIDEARKHMRRMGYLHNGFVLLSLLFFIRLILHNKIAREIVYGTFRLLVSVFNSGYMRIKS